MKVCEIHLDSVIKFINDNDLYGFLGMAVWCICQTKDKDQEEKVFYAEKAKWFIERHLESLPGDPPDEYQDTGTFEETGDEPSEEVPSEIKIHY